MPRVLEFLEDRNDIAGVYGLCFSGTNDSSSGFIVSDFSKFQVVCGDLQVGEGDCRDAGGFGEADAGRLADETHPHASADVDLV